MQESVLSFTQVKVSFDLLKEVWEFDPRKLDDVQGKDLSKYCMALAQYLIYFTYQRNLAKANIHRLDKYIDRRISLAIASDPAILKKHKNKTAASDYLITEDEDLTAKQAELEQLQMELLHIDGIDKVIGELIATIKRELTRRENELYQIRVERKG